MTNLLVRPKRRADIVSTPLDDEILVYLPQGMTCFALNSSASSIWQLCDGERTVAQIVALLQEAYPEEAETIPAQVESSLRMLSSHGIVDVPRLEPIAVAFDVELGGATARLEADDAAAAERLAFLCEAMATEHRSDAAVVFRLGPGTGAGSTAVYRDDVLLYQDRSAGGASGILLEKLQDHLVQQCSDGILLHAAALAHGTQSVILAGKTGAGKTTLATWLVRRGFDYLTDELVWIDAGGTVLRGFARPLHLKTDARRLFADLFAARAGDAVAETACGYHLAPLRLGARTRREASPDVLVFPRYTAGASTDLQRLSKAQSAVRAMSCLVNAQGRARHGFDDVARLVHDVSAYAMVYSDLDEAGHALESLLVT